MYSTVSAVRMAVSSAPNPDNPPAEPTGTAADLDNATLQDAIEEADSTIDTYIGNRYVTPVALAAESDGTLAVPHPIDYWSRNIAAYNATLTFRNSQDFSDTDPIARRYNATMAALNLVQSGKATLRLPEPGDDTGSGVGDLAGAPINQYANPLFNEGQFEVEGQFGSGHVSGIMGAWPFDWIR